MRSVAAKGCRQKFAACLILRWGPGVPVRFDRSSDLSAVIGAIAGTCRHEADGIVGSHQHVRLADLMRVHAGVRAR